jgi:acetylornithine/succinyldiaminopimelate/putrescine aminotransferase
MLTHRQLFLQYIAQTSEMPLMLEPKSAKGIYIYDINDKKYFDLISGISVSNIGHRNKTVIKAIKNQINKYLYLNVYGEYVIAPQVKFAELLCSQLPVTLNSVYLVNSGAEANEGAIKLAKRYTGRYEIIAFKNAYHGSTNGALSLMGNEELKNKFRPLLPGIKFIEFNNEKDLELITTNTAAVIIEPVQGEAGVISPNNNFLLKLRERCTKTGALLIFDEIQTGFGRTGYLFAFQKYNVIPDMLTIAKAMGGGMPAGAFISSKEIMTSLSKNPNLGHITTFGGHPVSAVAALASLKYLIENKIIENVEQKGALFEKLMCQSKEIKEIRRNGLLIAIELESFDKVIKTIKNGLNNGIIVDWFLFNNKSLRIAPPLIITEKEIKIASNKLLLSLK